MLRSSYFCSHDALHLGLDKISTGFQSIVGNSGVGGTAGAGVIFSAAVIFLSEFSLYFGVSKKPKTSNRRVLTWFFSHFFYLSALILTLQGKITLLHYLQNHELLKTQTQGIGDLLKYGVRNC